MLKEQAALIATITQPDFNELVALMQSGDAGAQAAIELIMKHAAENGTKLDTSQVKAKLRWKLEKFDGDYSPEKTPFEVIEGEDE